MSRQTVISVHGADAVTNIESKTHTGVHTYARLSVGNVDLYTSDPVFLRRLANTASALAHQLDLALTGEQVSA